MRPLLVSLATLLVCVALRDSPALAQVNAGTPYELASGSTYEDGCFGLCDCAILTSRLEGTFALRYAGFDGLYDHYDVLDVRWIAHLPDRDLALTGAGEYRIGGEVALMQELDLELAFDGGSTRRFRSGRVPGGGGFPKLDVVVSINGMSEVCRDTALHVIAGPVNAGTGTPTLVTGLGRATPNPFRHRIDLELVTAGTATVEARVYDAQGRSVRRLAGGVLPAGRHALSWDGRTEHGDDCPAGLYFVGAQANGRAFVRRLVKLR